MKHKGYFGTAAYSHGDHIFHGQVLGVHPSISYQGRNIEELTENFREAVNEYLRIREEIAIALRDELLQVEKDREAGQKGYTVEELDEDLRICMETISK